MSMSIAPVGPMTAPSQTPQAMAAALKDSSNNGDPRGATAAVNNGNAIAHNVSVENAGAQTVGGDSAGSPALRSLHRVDIKA
jgi:hypothetical protein